MDHSPNGEPERFALVRSKKLEKLGTGHLRTTNSGDRIICMVLLGYVHKSRCLGVIKNRKDGSNETKLAAPCIDLCLALTLTLLLMPTVWASDKGSKDNPYVYTGYNQGDFTAETGFDTTTYPKDTEFGAFAKWVNDKLESINELYIRIEKNILTTRQDVKRETLTIGNGKMLYLELVNYVRVGNKYEGTTPCHNPYFLVEPDGTLEITGQGRIVNREKILMIWRMTRSISGIMR